MDRARLVLDAFERTRRMTNDCGWKGRVQYNTLDACVCVRVANVRQAAFFFSLRGPRQAAGGRQQAGASKVNPRCSVECAARRTAVCCSSPHFRHFTGTCPGNQKAAKQPDRHTRCRRHAPPTALLSHSSLLVAPRQRRTSHLPHKAPLPACPYSHSYQPCPLLFSLLIPHIGHLHYFYSFPYPTNTTFIWEPEHYLIVAHYSFISLFLFRGRRRARVAKSRPPWSLLALRTLCLTARPTQSISSPPSLRIPAYNSPAFCDRSTFQSSVPSTIMASHRISTTTAPGDTDTGNDGKSNLPLLALFNRPI